MPQKAHGIAASVFARDRAADGRGYSAGWCRDCAPDQPLVTLYATAPRAELTAALAEAEQSVLGLFAESLVE